MQTVTVEAGDDSAKLSLHHFVPTLLTWSGVAEVE